MELSARFAQAPDQAQPDQEKHWQLHPVAVSSHLLDYVPGRDTLISAPEMAAGLDAFDRGTGEHVLWAAALPDSALGLARPFVLRWGPLLCPLTLLTFPADSMDSGSQTYVWRFV